MKQQDIDRAVLLTSADNGLGERAVLIVVYQFLTLLIERAGWFSRQVLRSVRGMVKTYADKRGVEIPIVG